MDVPSLLELLRRLPPGSLVPAGWVVDELAQTGDGEVPHPEGELADFRVGEVATELNRSPATVRSWCREERIPGAYRLRGREWRIPRDGLRAFLEGEAKRPAKREEAPLDRPGRTVDLGAWRKERGDAT